jgi:hypothetical protein
MYHPSDYPDGVDNTEEEFIELHNISDVEIPLYDTIAPTNTYILTGAINSTSRRIFLFRPKAILIVSFDPVLDIELLNILKTKYNIPDNVQILGPWYGKLNNNEDVVELKKPEDLDLNPGCLITFLLKG